MTQKVLHDVSENWVAWLQSMATEAGGECRKFGTIAAASVGVPIPLFNQAFVLEPPAADDLCAATEWLSSRNVPYWVTTPAPLADTVSGLGVKAGLDRSPGRMPGMVLPLLRELSTTTPPGFEIRRVDDPAQLEDVAVVTSEAFGAPLEAARFLAPGPMLNDERITWFTGHVDGDVAACGQLLRTGSVAGVYTIAVRENHRRKGFGTAITAAVLAAGQEQGCDVGILQSSPMGLPVYERMGFETIVDYHLFGPAE